MVSEVPELTEFGWVYTPVLWLTEDLSSPPSPSIKLIIMTFSINIYLFSHTERKNTYRYPTKRFL